MSGVRKKCCGLKVATLTGNGKCVCEREREFCQLRVLCAHWRGVTCEAGIVWLWVDSPCVWGGEEQGPGAGLLS